LDAADASTVTLSGSNVTQWNDKSGKGFNATTPAGTNSPTYLPATKELQFVDTNTNVLRIAQGFGDALVGTTYSIFFLGRRTAASGFHFFLGSTGNFGGRVLLMIGFFDNTMQTNVYDSAFNSSITTYTSPDPVRLYCYEVQSSSLATHILNGTQIGSNTQNYTLTSFANPELGRRYGQTFHTFNLSEMIAFSPALTTSQRQQIEGYLAHKWGLIGPSSTSPLLFPGCQLWLDAADSSSLVLSGSSVTTWNDKSGNGYHMNTLTQTAGWTGTAVYPTIGTSINGLQTVNFVAQSGLKQATTLDGVKNLFWVGRIAAAVGSSAGGFANFFLLGHDSHYDWHPPIGEKFILSGVAQSGIADASPASLFTNDPNAVTNTAFKNINLPSPPNVSLLSVAGITGTSRYQGICYDRQTHTGWCGDLAEVLIYSTALTTAQRQTIENYLMKKWGIGTTSSSLISTHPFNRITPASLPFSPRNISGLQLWLDAADQSSITLSGSSVTQWSDKSGNARHLGVGSGTTSYSSNAIQLANSYMFVSSPVDLSSVTVFIVAKTTGGNNQTVFEGRPTSSPDWNSLDGFGFYMDSQSSIRFYGQQDVWQFSTFSVSTSTPQVFSFQSSGTSVSGWYNGVSQSGGTLSSSRTSTAQGFAIGAAWYNGSYINVIANTSLYEIITYNTVLTTTQRQQVEGYLAQKWGLTASLPSTHPFKKLPA
jgi:hypothetical protein